VEDPFDDVEDLPALLRQSKQNLESAPRYSPSDIALIEEMLARVGKTVESAYPMIECLPDGAKMRKACRRKLAAKWKKLHGSIRFCLQFGLPVEMELEQLDQLEEHILAYFPEAELRVTLN